MINTPLYKISAYHILRIIYKEKHRYGMKIIPPANIATASFSQHLKPNKKKGLCENHSHLFFTI